MCGSAAIVACATWNVAETLDRKTHVGASVAATQRHHSSVRLNLSYAYCALDAFGPPRRYSVNSVSPLGSPHNPWLNPVTPVPHLPTKPHDKPASSAIERQLSVSGGLFGRLDRRSEAAITSNDLGNVFRAGSYSEWFCKNLLWLTE